VKREEYGKSPVDQEYHTWLSRLASIHAQREHRTNRRSGCESEKLRSEHVGVNAQPKVWRDKADILPDRLRPSSAATTACIKLLISVVFRSRLISLQQKSMVRLSVNNASTNAAYDREVIGDCGQKLRWAKCAPKNYASREGGRPALATPL
jgi:hypothetical protein